MNRGNRRSSIYEDGSDRRRFLRIWIQELKRYGVVMLAGCEMGTHFHGAVMTPNGNVSDFMEQLQGQFARYSNWRYERVGHLFQGRFRGVVIEHDVQLLVALCYVFFNPVSAGLCRRPEDYQWSTYAATVGVRPLPSYLSIDWLQTLFPDATLDEAQQRFHELMASGDPVFEYFRQNDAAVDSEAVRRVVRSYTGQQLQLGMLPRVYRSALRSSLAELLTDGMSLPARADAIYNAHVVHGYTLNEIARELRVHKSTVSKIYRNRIKRTE